MKAQSKSILRSKALAAIKNIEKGKKTILIVEDKEPIRIALRNRLMDEDYKVIEAGDGEEGLRAALIGHPDLILLDIVMPKTDGITMLQKLRQDRWGEKAKVIILTNLNDMTNIVGSVEHGSCGYLIKSDWKINDVVREICKYLDE